MVEFSRSGIKLFGLGGPRFTGTNGSSFPCQQQRKKIWSADVKPLHQSWNHWPSMNATSRRMWPIRVS